MMPTRQGSFQLTRFAGIDIRVHWSWFLVAAYEVTGARGYHSPLWNVLEYLSLFGIVLLHELGHSLACRSVGGQADHIILWPLGGVAYVAPPQRPGAMLWSIAAGPLVNVVLLPLFLALSFLAGPSTPDDVARFLDTLLWINTALLVFNLLPVYPLDGGQILRSILWYFTGRARSLMLVSLVGMGGVVLLGLLALYKASWMLGLMSVFILMSCWRGLAQARQLARVAEIPRHPHLRCPSCDTSPPIGPLWACDRCQSRFDTFASRAVCPECAKEFPTTLCFDCGAWHPIASWSPPPPVLRR